MTEDDPTARALRAEAETIQQPPAEAKELDPLPLVNYYSREDRYSGHVLPGGLCTFMPRPEYEQDPARYPWYQR